MNKRILVAIVIAVVIAVFSALRGNEHRAIGGNPAVVRPRRQQQSIDRLTQQQTVVSYLQQHQRLPDYYVTKKQAREQAGIRVQATSVRYCRARRLAAIDSLTVKGNCRAPAAGSGAKRTSITSVAGVAPIACCIRATV